MIFYVVVDDAVGARSSIARKTSEGFVGCSGQRMLLENSKPCFLFETIGREKSHAYFGSLLAAWALNCPELALRLAHPKGNFPLGSRNDIVTCEFVQHEG